MKEDNGLRVLVEHRDRICIMTLNRPEVRNAVDRETAAALADAFRSFDADPGLSVAILQGAGGTFCAGADLKAVSSVPSGESHQLDDDMSHDGPMGPTRMRLSKPVIAAVSGYAVAGGLELALWCDLRVADRDAVFGVFCRRFGVPLIDGGTQRLPRLIGMSRAMDLILTGRPVGAEEAFQMGLVNRLAEPGEALEAAVDLATQIAGFPQGCLRSDRQAVLQGFDLPFDDAMALEFQLGKRIIQSGETREGAQRFASGHGRHGHFQPIDSNLRRS